MSDPVINDQPQVAAAATEAPPVEETTPTVAAADEGDKTVDSAAAADAQNGEEKKSENMLKTTTQANPKDFKKNRKYDPTSQPVTDDPVKIRGQVCQTHPPKGTRPFVRASRD